MKAGRQSQNERLRPFSPLRHSTWNACFGKGGVDPAVQGVEELRRKWGIKEKRREQGEKRAERP